MRTSVVFLRCPHTNTLWLSFLEGHTPCRIAGWSGTCGCRRRADRRTPRRSAPPTLGRTHTSQTKTGAFRQRCTSVQERKCPRQWVAVQTLFGEDGVPVLHEEEVDRLDRRQESVVLQRMRTQKLRSQKAAKRWKSLKAVEQMDGNARANPLKTHELHSWLAPHTTSITNNLRLHTLHMAPTPSSGTSRK